MNVRSRVCLARYPFYWRVSTFHSPHPIFVQSVIRSAFPLSDVAHALPRDARSYFLFCLFECKMRAHTKKRRRRGGKMIKWPSQRRSARAKINASPFRLSGRLQICLASISKQAWRERRSVLVLMLFIPCVLSWCGSLLIQQQQT